MAAPSSTESVNELEILAFTRTNKINELLIPS